MKLFEIFGHRSGETEWHNSHHEITKPKAQFWIVDKATGKKLEGPFPDYDAGVRFKRNRKDKIPANAPVIPL